MSTSLDARIAATARAQRGSITTEQLLHIGLGHSGIHHRVARGQLIRVYRGVYAVGHLPNSIVDRAAAAVLACGPKATLSHASAMSLWGMARRWTLPFEVTTPTRRRPSGISVHCSRALTPADLRRHLGVHVTSPARTLLDQAPALRDRALRRAFNDARSSGHLHLAAVADLLARVPRHPGASRLARLADAGPRPTRSDLEDAFVAFVKAYDLPEPQVNVRLHGREVDALFTAERLIVELDGRGFHSDPAAFEDDRERDAHHLVAGYPTVRITWERLTERPAAEAERLRRILAAPRFLPGS